MYFKKCTRCGSFHTSENDICLYCKSKENGEIAKVKDYMSSRTEVSSLEELSTSTGISIENLKRIQSLQEMEDMIGNL